MNLLQNFHHAVIEYLYRGRRVVRLQTFTTRHSNRRSGSFKVTDFGTNRKLIYDFLLVINTNLPPILHHFGDTAFQMSKIAIFDYSSCI